MYLYPVKWVVYVATHRGCPCVAQCLLGKINIYCIPTHSTHRSVSNSHETDLTTREWVDNHSLKNMGPAVITKAFLYL